MDLEIRKVYTIIDEVRSDAGIIADKPLRKVAVAAVVENPYANGFQEDLNEGIKFGEQIGKLLSEKAVKALDDTPEGYGKGGIVGINGELDHANMLLTTTMANEFRKAVGGGKAWISSTSKRGAPGCTLDIPLAHKDALYVRSHYDTMEIKIPDAPLPNEIVVAIVLSNRGRLNYRLGGLKKEDIKGQDGLS